MKQILALFAVCALLLAQNAPSPIVGKPQSGTGMSLDMSGGTHVKSMQVGTVIPSTCSVGELFFKSDATAGVNIYACTATNTFTVQAGVGSGASAISQLTDNLPARATTSATNDSVTWNGSASSSAPVVMSQNGVAKQYTASSKCIVAGATNTGKVWVYYDASTFVCGIQVITGTGSVTQSGPDTATALVTGFPIGSKPMWTWTFTNGVFDSSGWTDLRSVFDVTKLAQGNGISISGFTISQDPTQTFVGTALLRSGTGSPNGAVTGNVGDGWLRTDGGASTTLYIKETGTATNTGWTAYGAGGSGSVSKPLDAPIGVCNPGSFIPVGWSSADGTANIGSCPVANLPILGVPFGVGHGVTHNFVIPASLTSMSVSYSFFLSGANGSFVLNASLGCLGDGNGFTTAYTFGTLATSSAYTSATNITSHGAIGSVNIPGGCTAGSPAQLRLQVDATSTTTAGQIIFSNITPFIQ